MNEASFASLNPSLLARKGGAKPAMRPQLAPLNQNGPDVASNLEDLGWNDMGDDDKDTGKPESQGQILHLTPEPANEAAAAESKAADKAAEEALADKQQSEVHRQQAVLAERVAKPAPTPAAPQEPEVDTAPKRTAKRRSAIARGKRAAFTLRLDEERHLKLRLLSTVKGRSAQQIVTEALDSLLESSPDIDSLAAQVQRR